MLAAPASETVGSKSRAILPFMGILRGIKEKTQKFYFKEPLYNLNNRSGVTKSVRIYPKRPLKNLTIVWSQLKYTISLKQKQ